MKQCWCLLLWCFCLQSLGQVMPSQLPIFAEGERLFAEGSYHLAAKAYQLMSKEGFSEEPEIQSWIDFRRLDCEWRALAGSRQGDSNISDRIWSQFDRLLRDFESRDTNGDFYQVRSSMLESAGDFWWVSRYRRNWHKAWEHYEKALELWAASSDTNLARNRYLGIVWKASHPPEVNSNYSYGHYRDLIPVGVLENAVKIAMSPEDKSRAHYLLAISLKPQVAQSPFVHERILRAFRAATSGAVKHAWMDDALNEYANWLAYQGRPVKQYDGEWRFRPDYPSAVKVWRRLVEWFDKSETRHFQQAEAQLKETTRKHLNVVASSAFVPGSKIKLHSQWRNIDHFRLKLYPVDLVKDIDFNRGGYNPREWMKSLKVQGLHPVYDQTFETDDKGEHEPGSQEIVLETTPKDGAYLAVGYVDGAEESRELVLISRLSVVARASTNRMVVWVCDSVDGHPLSGAEVKLWQRVREGRRWVWNAFDRKADDQGLVVFEDMSDFSSMEWLVTARHMDQQNLSHFSNPRKNAYQQAWKMYAFSDRPAYRPEDLVQWKVIVRNHSDGGYSTPASKKIKIRLRDPKGSIVMDETMTLNAFGSIARNWQPAKESPLGMYVIECDDEKDNRMGAAQLFRLEEYKRPEMKLSIRMPVQEGEGDTKIPRPGDKVILEAHAEYYFGGGVSEADAEVRVYRRPYHFIFPRRETFPWLSEAGQSRRSTYNSNSEVLEHEFTLKTDANGKLLIEFDASADLSNDMSYRVEVRITDASRREIVGQHELRVARQGHFAKVKTNHQLVRPGDQLAFDVDVMDVNERPVKVTGELKVLRKVWREVWWTPEGVELTGAPLNEIMQRHAVFPPSPARPDQRPWRLKERAYTTEVVSEITLTTGAEGRAKSSFTPDLQGYYSVVWISQDNREGALQAPGDEVRSETDFWVSLRDSKGLGYHPDGVEIIVDQDTFKSGQSAPVMLSVPTSNRWVLLTLESDHMIEHRVLHVEGTVRMTPIEITPAHIPNFYIQAMMVSDHEIHRDSERITVPPVQEFLNVEVISSAMKYAPGEQAELEIKVTNNEGDPVEGEVAVAVYDSSVTYIQQDIAGDSRQVFYGETRSLYSQFGGHWRSFEKLLELKNGSLIQESQYRHWIEMGIDPNRLNDEAASYNQRQGALMQFGRGYGGIDPLTGLPIGGGGFGQGGGGGGLGGGGGGFGLAAGREVDYDSIGFPRALAQTASAPMSMAKSEASSIDPITGLPSSGRDSALADSQASEIIVRHDFNATAFWEPTLLTDAKGYARATFKLPDSLTTWKIDARAIDRNTKVGNGVGNFGTRHPLFIRLQTPRFLVVGDMAVLSAIVHNQSDQTVRAQVSFESRQIQWSADVETAQNISIPANGEYRIHWPGAMAVEPGEIKLKASVRSQYNADAVEMSLPAFEHGMEQMIGWSGKSREKEITLPVKFPDQRKPESTQLIVQVTPSLAVTMLDALPYLIDFPYGCTEQTLSRFLPAVIVRHTLEGVGLSMDALNPGAFGGVDPSKIQFTHRSGFEALSEVHQVTSEGLKRLADMQHGDGGWGWWEDGSSDAFMTAYVVWGLSLADDAGVEFDHAMLHSGKEFLAANIVIADNQPDLQSWMLHALYAAGAEGMNDNYAKALNVALNHLLEQRDALNAYSRALLILSAHRAGKNDAAMTLVRNLENGVIRTEASAPSRLQSGTLSGSSAATAHWGEDGIYHRWSEGGVEATAMALRALLAVDPDNGLVEPVVRWLIQNRRGAHWSNTRDTSMTLLALSDYLKVSGELEADLQYEIYAGKKLVATEHVTTKNLLKAPSRFVIPNNLIQDTTELRIVRTSGSSPFYYGVEATWYSLENPIPAAGNELFVRRDFFRLKEVPTLLQGSVLNRVPLLEGEDLHSGERVEVVLTLESRNHYEYLLIEDMKPAGLEAVSVQSGTRTFARQFSQRGVEQFELEGRPSMKPDMSWRWSGRSQSIHQEWRDRKVALFIDKLPEGLWEIRYTMRAEVPGTFSAMPALGYAMYIPEIRGNSQERRFEVMDRSKE